MNKTVSSKVPSRLTLLCSSDISVRNFGVINVKSSVSQISRRYILKMETYGYLTGEDRNDLVSALSDAGLENISLEGTDMSEVGYGNKISLYIHGTTEDGYEINEFRTSTAKYQ